MPADPITVIREALKALDELVPPHLRSSSDGENYIVGLRYEKVRAALAALPEVEGQGWRPIESAPKGGGAEYTTDPNWVKPPALLLAFPNGEICVCRYEWYYDADGGHGAAESGGVGWAEVVNGDPVVRVFGMPTHWMPLPPPPAADPARALAGTEAGAAGLRVGGSSISTEAGQ